MSKQNATIKMIPVDKVNILNPRVRNPKMFDAIVQNIAKVGLIPITLALSIMLAPQNEQQALQEAYESGQLSGHKFMAAKRLFDERRRSGKTMRGSRKHVQVRRDDTISAREILKAYKREVERKRLLARKADVVNTRLLFLVEAMHCLIKEGHFTTLLRAEGLDTMPRQLADLLAAKGG